jgi:hypothetical protein
MIRKRSDSRYRDLAKMITGHIEQHRARLPNGARASGACGISGVVALSPTLWLSNR